MWCGEGGGGAWTMGRMWHVIMTCGCVDDVAWYGVWVGVRGMCAVWRVGRVVWIWVRHVFMVWVCRVSMAWWCGVGVTW